MLCVVLRALAEAKIKWAFWPPGVSLPAEDHREKLGIWLGDAVEDEDQNGSDVESVGTVSSEEDTENETSATSEEIERELEEVEEVDGEEAEGREGEARVMGVGRFGALSIDDELE